MKNKFLLLQIVALFLFGSNLYAQALYSYLDETGVQVFTNIPPINQVRDLKITGAIPSPTVPVSDQESGIL